MSYQPLAVRFNMKRADDRRAWELLQNAQEPKIRVIVNAINAYFSQENRLAEAIAVAVRESLQAAAISLPAPQTATAISQEEAEFLDAATSFLGE